jgi:hypothetical protein
MTPADIQPEDPETFDLGVLAGQDAAINGLPLTSTCVNLHAEGPSVPHLAADGAIEGGMTLFSLVAHGIAGGILEGVLLVVNLSIALETFTDDPDTALAQEATALQSALRRLGIEDSMELFLGGSVDTSVTGCELQLTSVFRTQEAAETAARGAGRSKSLVVSWRTDQSGGVKVVAFSGD